MSSERKVFRRQSKYKNILKNDYGILTDNTPSKSLMVCNVGLVNGCQREYLLDIFTKFGKINAVVMPKGKSYSFVSFYDESEATACYSEMNGKCVMSCVEGPVYLLYLKEIPQDDSLSNFSDFPSGLLLFENFVDEVEEKSLLDCVKFDESVNEAELKNRLVKHFGYEFLYGCNNIDRDRPLDLKIPEQCHFIFDRLNKRSPATLPRFPDQLTVNRYRPGQGIPSHIDTHSAFHDPILSLSLGSDSVMDFRRESKTISVLLPQRSLLVMSGESRYAWTHGICPRKSDVVPHSDGGLTVKNRGVRTSFTFRCIRHTPCDCCYKPFCDSQAENCDITEEVAPSLENSYVHEVYDKISEHFSDTRHKPWPNVLHFVSSFPSGSIVIDVGCGNGKYFRQCPNLAELGLDSCYNLIKICRERSIEGIVSNCLSLPVRSDVADCVICIAVIHHLSTEYRRVQAIKEMARIVRIGGKILIYVWAKNQSADDQASSYLKQSRKNRKADLKSLKAPENSQTVCEASSDSFEIKGLTSTSEKYNLKIPLHENRTQFQHKDLLVPWKLKTGKDQSFPTFLRFYHVFQQNELEKLCSQVKNVSVEKSYYDQGNWCVILTKTK